MLRSWFLNTIFYENEPVFFKEVVDSRLQLRKVQVDLGTSCARKQGTARKEGARGELGQKEWEPAQLAALVKSGQFNY